MEPTAIDPTILTIIVIAVVALIVVGVIVALAKKRKTEQRREHLQERFGPEYDRAVNDSDKTAHAEDRLAAAEQRREQLDIRPLSADSRTRKIEQWGAVQARFVDEPVDAVDDADRLVSDVMAERGYPTGNLDEKLKLLATDHAEVVSDYRTAEAHRDSFRSGDGSTEDLRRAFVKYRELFDLLVHEGENDSAATVGSNTRPDERDMTDRDTTSRVRVMTDSDGGGQHAATPQPEEVDVRDDRGTGTATLDGDRTTSTRRDDVR